MWGNSMLGKDAWRVLLAAVEEGKIPELEELDLHGSNACRDVVARILAFVEMGSCPRLKTVVVDKVQVEAEWVQRLKDRGVDVI